jgi:hypothetical protein
MGKYFDALLIPGGGFTETGDLPKWTKRRLDRAAELWNGEYVITLSASTVHKPPELDSGGFPVYECTAAAHYLIAKGVQAAKILREHASYDTIGNAYFSRVMHTDPRHWRKLLVITSEFHIKRTEEIFRWVFSLNDPQPPYSIEFVSVTDKGIEPKILLPRIKKEKASLADVAALKKRIRTLQDFHDWLFTSHGAYSVSTKPKRHRGDILETY